MVMSPMVKDAIETKPILDAFMDTKSGFIFIAGPTCSGKTSFTYRLKAFFEYMFKTVTIIKEDDYCKDLSGIQKNEFGYLTDNMDAFYLEEMKNDFKLYIKNGKAEIPMYDSSTKSRLHSKQYIVRSQITIVEGLHTISLFYGLLDSLYIYLDTPIEECFERRIKKDKYRNRNLGIDVKTQFRECILPSYRKEILPQRSLEGVICYNPI